jgi:hypothetical protein
MYGWTMVGSLLVQQCTHAAALLLYLQPQQQ